MHPSATRDLTKDTLRGRILRVKSGQTRTPTTAQHPIANINRRWATRRPCCVAGTIVTPRSTPIRCSIRDTSSTGAMIELAQLGEAIPPIFTLVMFEAARNCEVTCRVMWQAGNRLGVRFDTAFRVSTKLVPVPKPMPKRR